MADLFCDGFDKYGPPTVSAISAAVQAALLAGEWTSQTNSAFQVVAGLSATGYALQITGSSNNQQNLSKTLAASASRLIGGVRFNVPLGTVCGVGFGDSGTQQCTISIDPAGTITLRTGTLGGTAIAGGGSISANSTHTLTWDITFGASAAYQVWLDGVSLFSGTGNTKTSGNSSANQFFFSGGGSANIYDDLYLRDATGSFANAPALDNPRIETQYASGDSAVQFTFGAAILGQAYSTTNIGNAPGANKLFLRKFTPPVACTINSVSCAPGATSAGANFKAVIYSDNSGSPNSLLSSGTQVTGTTNGSTLTGALVTPQSLTAATPYWIGFITDTSVILFEVDSTTTGASATNTYTSGAPATAPAMTTGLPSWQIWGNLSGITVNWAEVAQNPPVGDLSYVFSSTVGQQDLYSFPALSSTPSTIDTVAVKGYIKKSDTGSRTISLVTKSSTSTSTGSNAGQTPATTYGWMGSFFPTDPATGTSWTPSGVNSATSGVTIAS